MLCVIGITESNLVDLSISAINVNSLNVSTYKNGPCKTVEKLVAITQRGCDVILISDCRIGRGIDKIKKILLLGKSTSYDLITNSTRGDRGVCIAVSRSKNIEIVEEIRDRVHENYLLIRCKIDGKEMLLGVVYGPNTNNVQFYRDLITIIEQRNVPTIIGGDFNTVLDPNVGIENLDLEDRENIPQKENGRVLREWLERGNFCEPFRRKYPMANEMSFIPFRTRRRVGDRWENMNFGKSRLDFFIMSESLYDGVRSVFYGNRLSRDFDHREAVLHIGKNKKQKEGVYIKNETLERPEIDEIGVLGFLNCVANHLMVRDVELLARVGELEGQYIEMCNVRRGIELELVDDKDAEQRRLGVMKFRWDVKIRAMGNIQLLGDRELSCTASSFYEVLLNEYKNRIVALQGGLDRDRKYRRKWLEANASVIKGLFGKESQQYKQCEDNILAHDTNQLRVETNKYIKFLNDNNEKATRKFCKLGKTCSAVDDIEQIQGVGGRIFGSQAERAEHIRSFYENLYKKKIDRVMEIESLFTGEEWDRVQRQGKKLDENTKQELEGEITLEELKKSLDKSNMASCPGWDGVSYKCIQKLWEFLKIPMLNMANESFHSGMLPDTLRTGLIKLIPKGKDSKRVEDWRPITLLPTSYKIISGVVATRLEKTLPHIIGRAQKGFLKYKNMGTVIHNVVDGIANSWAEDEQMGVLLVDFIKAFDSVEHAFIKKAMEHFNIGPVLVGMVMTLLRERQACINLGHMYSGRFDIKRGTPQGDRASPYIFLICVEILLIKLELGGEGKIISRNAVDLDGNPVSALNEAFADDLTVQFRLIQGAAEKILSILETFGDVSGLQINKEKTHIMVSGRDWDGDDNIEGIKIKRECRLLGVNIDNRAKNLEGNWENCIVKIRGLINYWNQFNLTISGRVLVAKTFLLSKVTFLLGFISLEKRNADKIELMIEKYVVGKLQIAKDRIYNKIEQGGLGLLKIQELETAMKCAWVNRWRKEGSDVDITGSMVLRTGGGRNIELIDKSKINAVSHPSAASVANAWHLFRAKVYENDGNLYSAQLFENPGITNRMGRTIGKGNIFGRRRYELLGEEARMVNIGMLVVQDGIKEKDAVSEILGLHITDVEYGKLRDIIKYLRGKFKPVWEMKDKGKGIVAWVSPIKKGSNKLRQLMSGRGSRVYRNFKFETIRPIRNLWEQLELELDEIVLSYGASLWNIKEVDTELRQFIFKWYQGMIHGNTVISHFGENVDRKCTFCKINVKGNLSRTLGREPTAAELNAAIINDENRKHIFWECETVNRTYREVFCGVWETNAILEKKHFLMGKPIICVEATQLFMLINMYIKNRVWKYKLANTLPLVNNIINDTRYFIQKLVGYNKWRIMLPLLRQHVRT